MPPRAGPTWDLDSLLAILHETYELAGIRSVDGDELGDLELLARGIYIAANVEEDPFTAGAFDVTVANTAVREPE